VRPIPFAVGDASVYLIVRRAGRRPRFRYNAAVTNHAGTVIVLLLLLAAFPVIDALPDQMAAIRLAGLSLLWWYGGVVAPVLAWFVAVMGLADGTPPRRSE